MLILHLGQTFGAKQVQDAWVWAIVIVSILVEIALYLLRSIGVYKLAKRQEIKNPILAWIPLLWFFIAIKLVGESRFFNKPIKKLAVLLCVIFALSEFITFAIDFMTYFPLVGNYLKGNTIYVFVEEELQSTGLNPYYWLPNVYVDQSFVYPLFDPTIYPIQSIAVVLRIVNVVMNMLSFATLFIEVFVYFALFRKYWPSHHVLAGILSTFGLFAPFVFAIRNKPAVNYHDYLRSRYGAYGVNFGNPYNGHNYGQGETPHQTNRPDYPFEDFADKKDKKPENPFKEFDDNDK